LRRAIRNIPAGPGIGRTAVAKRLAISLVRYDTVLVVQLEFDESKSLNSGRTRKVGVFVRNHLHISRGFDSVRLKAEAMLFARSALYQKESHAQHFSRMEVYGNHLDQSRPQTWLLTHISLHKSVCRLPTSSSFGKFDRIHIFFAAFAISHWCKIPCLSLPCPPEAAVAGGRSGPLSASQSRACSLKPSRCEISPIGPAGQIRNVHCG